MENIGDNNFDEKLRQMLSDAEEMPPERVWDSIVSSMEKGVAVHRLKTVMLSAAGLVSAAAAVAAFFLLRAPETEGQKDIPSELVADAVEVAGGAEAAESIETVEAVEFAGSVEALEEVEEAEAVETIETAEEADVAEAPGVEEVAAEAETPVQAQTAQTQTIETDTPAETDSPAAVIEIAGNNLLADAAWNGPVKPARNSDEHIYELCLGGNSFVGPSHKTESIRMMSQGRFKIPTSTSFVENNDTDYYWLPISFGAGVKFRILKWLDVGIGLNYTLLTKRVSGTYYEYGPSGNLVRTCSTELKNSQHYIGVPLDIYFNIFGNEKWNTYASLGGCIEKCVCNHYSGSYDNIAINHKVLVNGIQTSVKLGLGVEYSPVKFLGIYLDPSLRYYFDNKQPRSIRTSQPLSFGMEAGLRFKL